MKTIVEDPEGFFEQGGWGFLEPESDVSIHSFSNISRVTLKHASCCNILRLLRACINMGPISHMK